MKNHPEKPSEEDFLTNLFFFLIYTVGYAAFGLGLALLFAWLDMRV